MNLGELRTRVTAPFGLDNTASSTEQGYVDSWLNEAVLRFQSKCPAAVYTSTFQLTLTAAVGDYDMPDLIDIIDMDLTPSGQSTTYPLERYSVEDVLAVRRPNNTQQFPMYYAVAGNNLIMFAPTPLNADTVNGVYIPRATAMSASTHDPSSSTYGGIPKEHHDALEMYAKWKAAEYDDNTPSKVGLSYAQQWDMRTREINRDARRKGGHRRRKIAIGIMKPQRYLPPGVDDGR